MKQHLKKKLNRKKKIIKMNQLKMRKLLLDLQNHNNESKTNEELKEEEEKQIREQKEDEDEELERAEKEVQKELEKEIEKNYSLSIISLSKCTRI